MQISRIGEWLQVIGALAVLAGLYLVAHEIRQNNELARAQTINDIYSGWEEFSISEYESDIFDLFIRSIEDADSLTAVEILKLDAYFTAIASLYGRQWVMFREFDLAYDPTLDTEYSAEVYFSGRFARSWFEQNKAWLQDSNPEMVRVFSRVFESTPVESELSLVNRLKSGL